MKGGIPGTRTDIGILANASIAYSSIIGSCPSNPPEPRTPEPPNSPPNSPNSNGFPYR